MRINYDVTEEEVRNAVSAKRVRHSENRDFIEDFLKREGKYACISFDNPKTASAKATLLRRIIKDRGLTINCVQNKEKLYLMKE